jgi:hypothetical protein
MSVAERAHSLIGLKGPNPGDAIFDQEERNPSWYGSRSSDQPKRTGSTKSLKNLVRSSELL